MRAGCWARFNMPKTELETTEPESTTPKALAPANGSPARKPAEVWPVGHDGKKLPRFYHHSFFNPVSGPKLF